MKQWSFLICNGDFTQVLAPLLGRETGETVEVEDNEGNIVTMPLLTGGWSQINNVGTWNALLTVSTEAGYADLLPNANVLELCRIANFDNPVELQALPDSTLVAALNLWLADQNLATVTPTTNAAFVNEVFGYFWSGFDCYSSVYIS